MSTKRLMIALGVLSMAGCDDSTMNLGPGGSTASGGNASTMAGASSGGAGATASSVAGASGSTPIDPLPGTGGVGTGGVGTGGVGTGGAFGIGGASGYGGQAGAPSINGLNLTGLKRFSLKVEAGYGGIEPSAPCKGNEPVTYSVDLESRALEYAHCAAGTDGGPIVARESRILSEEELTAGMMMLEQISLDYDKHCGQDKGAETLVLSFADRQESYQDDFYAGCQGGAQPPPTYVANMEWIHVFLREAWSTPTIPADYHRLEIGVAAKSDVQVQMVTECDTSYVIVFDIDFSTSQVVESRCERPSLLGGGVGPAQLITTTKPLNEARLTNLRSAISVLKLGATRQCQEPLGEISQGRLYWGVSSSAGLVDARAACPGQSNRYFQFVIELDEVYWEMYSYFHPLI